jgi:hypothetical protein
MKSGSAAAAAFLHMHGYTLLVGIEENHHEQGVCK